MPTLTASQPIDLRSIRRVEELFLVFDPEAREMRALDLLGGTVFVFGGATETPGGFTSEGPILVGSGTEEAIFPAARYEPPDDDDGDDVVLAFDDPLAPGDLFPPDEGLVFTGSSGRDVVDGGRVDDDLTGAGGADVLIGLDGADDIFGGAGNDIGRGGRGNDSLEGGRGADRLFGGGDDDILGGGGGGDLLNGGGASDVIDGGGGDDRIVGGAGDDGPLEGGVGADTILGGGGNDFIGGGPGNDRLVGGAGNDVLLGDGGNDIIVGGGGDNGIYGGDGNDFINAGPGSNRIEIAPGDRQRADRVVNFDPNGGVGFDPDTIFALADDPDLLSVVVRPRAPGRFDATVIVSEAGERARILVDFAGGERRETATADELGDVIEVSDFF